MNKKTKEIFEEAKEKGVSWISNEDYENSEVAEELIELAEERKMGDVVIALGALDSFILSDGVPKKTNSPGYDIVYLSLSSIASVGD